MKEGLIFANARAKAKEHNLFTQERLFRMMETDNLRDAVRILIEANYGGGTIVDDEEDFAEILEAEMRLVSDFVKEAVPKGVGFECFLLRNDYHNIKVLLKAKYGNIADIDDLIMPDGIYSLSALKDKVETLKLDFTLFLQEAIEIIDKMFELGEGSPRVIDTLIDKAMYTDIMSRLETHQKSHIKDYFIKEIDTTNILSFLRVHKIGEKMSFFSQNFIEGGELDIKVFADSYADPYNRLPIELRGTPYSDIIEYIDKADFSIYETMQDNFLLKIFSSNKADMFSEAPIIGYYLAKQNEIKVLRIVLVCIKNQVPKADIKKRVRALYA